MTPFVEATSIVFASAGANLLGLAAIREYQDVESLKKELKDKVNRYDATVEVERLGWQVVLIVSGTVLFIISGILHYLAFFG